MNKQLQGSYMNVTRKLHRCYKCYRGVRNAVYIKTECYNVTATLEINTQRIQKRYNE